MRFWSFVRRVSHIGWRWGFKALTEKELSEVDTSTSSYGIINSWKPIFLPATTRKAVLLPPIKKPIEGICKASIWSCLSPINVYEFGGESTGRLRSWKTEQ